jgi:hypothetical protein
VHGKAEDAGGLTPAKDDNAAMRALHPRAFARNFGDCYKGPVCRTYPIDGPSFGWNSGAQRKEWIPRRGQERLAIFKKGSMIWLIFMKKEAYFP